VVETVEMLTLDALEYAPVIGVVLTAREHLTRKQTYSHLKQLRLVVRRRWADAEWFVVVEFQLRGALHLNLLVKGVPVEAVDAFREVVLGLWCSRVDAERPGQWVKALTRREGGAEGFVRYVAKIMSHSLKPSQAPPIGWRGHRTSHTRGYLVRPTPVMREEARASLRMKRELWRVLAEGLTGHDAELEAQLRYEANRAEGWTFVSTWHLATQTGWEELAQQMARRDVEPDPMTWADVDRLVVDVGTCDAARDAHEQLVERADRVLAGESVADARLGVGALAPAGKLAADGPLAAGAG
jgi:hypothetical protein